MPFICVVQPKEPVIDYTRFIKFGRLLRAVAWIRRFICNLSVKEEERIDSSLTELQPEGAEEWLITRVEEASIPEYVRSVIKHGALKNRLTVRHYRTAY